MRSIIVILSIISVSFGCQAADTYKNIWRLSKPDIHPPYMVDCTNCNDEEVNAAFYCYPETKKITLELYASATEVGEENAMMPATVRLSFRDYNRQVKLKLYEINGYTPVLTLDFSDPIFNELKHTHSLTLNIGGIITEYSSAGLSTLFGEFLKRCKSH